MSEQEINIDEHLQEGDEAHEEAGIHTPPIKPDTLFKLGSFEVSNAIFGSIVATLLVLAIVAYLKKRIAVVPGKIQIVAEAFVNFFYEKLETAYNDKSLAKKHTAFIMSFFIFILVSNLLPAIPFISSIRWDGHLEAIRPATSHYSFTVALAITSIGGAHLIGLSHHGLGHVNKFIRLGEIFKIRKLKHIPNALFELFFGFLETLGEFSKILSLASRLFGNIFAHEIIVAVIIGISVFTQFLAPVPFYVLGFLVALIQATVFSLLSLSILVSHAKGH